MRRILIFFLVLIPQLVSSQINWAEIDSIEIRGNRKTKSEIILREIDFCAGDSISLENLQSRLDWNSLQLMNTGLFANAKFHVVAQPAPDNCLQLRLELEEAWYIYPVPIFELADRYFNVWWNDYNHRLDRINYGMRFYHFNFTGRKDQVKLIGQFGYTNQFGIHYILPYLDRNKTIGISFAANYRQNRELQYNTIGDRQQFYKDDNRFLLKRMDALFSLHYRPAYTTYHSLGLYYTYNWVDDFVIRELNPDIFGNGSGWQRYFSLVYFFTFDNRNMKPFPTSGKLLEVVLQKDGLGRFDDLNTFSVRFDLRNYYPFGSRWNLENILKSKTSFNRAQLPYFNRRALGFSGSFVRGYEHYVVDGLDYWLLKNSIRYELLNKEIHFGKWVPLSAFRNMPVKVYLALNGDLGYVNDPFSSPGNLLGNEVLAGGGLGLNFVFYYNKVFKLEYSVNALQERGLFIHTELGF